MKKYLFMAVAAIAALSSCSSDNDFEQSQTGRQALVFTATMENSEATRATFDNTEKCAAWEAGDQISINGKTYSAQEAGTTTTFKADGEGATGTTYNAYFPADLYDGTTATLPAIQTYEAGEFNMPMYASSTTTELQFYNLCAVLAIKITSADIATLKSIKVASDQVMNGKFIVTDNKAVINDDEATNAVVLESSTAITLDGTGTTFYIAIPAQEYQYLNIFLSADGETYTQAMATKKAAGLGPIARSKIFNIDYAKNATKLWEGNLFIADCNVGATSAIGFGGYYGWGGSQDKGGDYNYGDASLTGDNDTATKLWGGNWRMPKAKDIKALVDNCSREWKTIESVKGYVFTGKDNYESNSVFLPAAGYYDVNGIVAAESGTYWSSQRQTWDDAYCLCFDSGDCNVGNNITDNCKSGNSVRAVLEEAATPTPPAPAGSTGTAKATIGGSEVDVNWVQLWKDGPKFAEYNVGATPDEVYGGYYCWGKTKDKDSNAEYWDGKELGDYDNATLLWGKKWRMPTSAELSNAEGGLLYECECVWTENYNGTGVNGILCTGKGAYSSNSVFLPAAGCCDWGDVSSKGESVYYWSSTPDDYNVNVAQCLYLDSSHQFIKDSGRRLGYSVRAVLVEE